MSRTREYVGTVSLLITGKSLDPTSVTRALRLAPTKSWRSGDLKGVGKLTFQTRHKSGGWKRDLTGARKPSYLEAQPDRAPTA